VVATKEELRTTFSAFKFGVPSWRLLTSRSGRFASDCKNMAISW
jgi:hypothetical protein